jgi:hypothetical protein
MMASDLHERTESLRREAVRLWQETNKILRGSIELREELEQLRQDLHQARQIVGQLRRNRRAASSGPVGA